MFDLKAKVAVLVAVPLFGLAMIGTCNLPGYWGILVPLVTAVIIRMLTPLLPE